MKITFRTLLSTLLLSSSLALVGCSSDSGSSSGGSAKNTYAGITTAAKVDGSNAEDFGTASGEAGQQASVSDALPAFASISNTDTGGVEALTRQLVEFVQNRPHTNLPSSYTEAGSCGGSVTIPESAYPESGPHSYSITFNNYCDASIDGNIIFNGRADYSTSDVNSYSTFTFQYINFTVTQNGETTTLNMTMTCTDSGCSITTDFVSSTGAVHRIADINISGNESTGYNGTMTFYHSAYGYVSVTVSALTYGDCGIFPDGGTISYTGTDSSSGSITFASDCTYSGDYDDGAGGIDVFTGSTI